MHILEIPSFFPPMGGEFCLEQSRSLLGRGHTVRILACVQLGVGINGADYWHLPWRRRWEQMEGVEVYRSYLRGFPKTIRWNASRWIEEVRQMMRDYVVRYGRPDVLHAHCAKWGGRVAMLIGREYGIPYFVTEHLPSHILLEELGLNWAGAWQLPLLREVYEHARCILPVAAELVDDLAPFFGRDYRWEEVSNAIDTTFFHYEPRSSDSRPFRFCYPALFIERKGYDVLFRAFAKVASHHEVELHIAGRGTDSTACHQLMIDLLGAHIHKVVLRGSLDKEGIRRMLYDCDCLVLPSRSEAQPLVVLEAMSTGIPVVGTSVIPRSERIEGACRVVAIDDAEALAEAMALQIKSPQPDGAMLSRKVGEIASPDVLASHLERIFSTLPQHA